MRLSIACCHPCGCSNPCKELLDLRLYLGNQLNPTGSGSHHSNTLLFQVKANRIGCRMRHNALIAFNTFDIGPFPEAKPLILRPLTVPKWLCYLLQDSACIDEDITFVLEGMPFSKICYIYLPLGFIVIPLGFVNAMSKPKVIPQSVLVSDIDEVLQNFWCLVSLVSLREDGHKVHSRIVPRNSTSTTPWVPMCIGKSR